MTKLKLILENLKLRNQMKDQINILILKINKKTIYEKEN